MDDDTMPAVGPITTQIDLEDYWHEVVQPLGFSSPSLRLLLIGPDDHPMPPVTEITDAYDLPDEEQRRGFVEFLRLLTTEVVPGGRVAMLRSRPGTEALNEDDLRWADLLYGAARSAGAPFEILHLATDVHLLPMPLDDLVGR
jgi:hypothetical protein